MPAFFKYTDNFKQQQNGITGDEKSRAKNKFAAPNNSTCNRVMTYVNSKFTSATDFDFKDFGTFDYRMLLRDRLTVDQETLDKVIDIFARKSAIRDVSRIHDAAKDRNDYYGSLHDIIICNLISKDLEANDISLEEAYISLVLFCFRDHLDKSAYKKLFFIMFGEMCYKNIIWNKENNKMTCTEPDYTQKRCAVCGTIISNKQTYCSKCAEEQKKIKQNTRNLVRNTKRSESRAQARATAIEETKIIIDSCNDFDEAVNKTIEYKHNNKAASWKEICSMLTDKFGKTINESAIKVRYNRKYSKKAAE